MLKASSKKAPKKVDAHGIYIDLDCETQHFAINLQAWNADFLLIEQGLNKCETALRKENTLSGSDLAKEYATAHTKMKRLDKAIEGMQKKLNKIQTEFEKKILTPTKNGEFSLATQPQNVLDEIALYTQKIQEMSAQNKTLMDPIVEKSLDYTRRLALLEGSITESCLPEELEDAVKASGKLSDRLEAICTATAALPQDESRSSTAVQSFAPPLLKLRETQGRQGKLLDQIEKNLGFPTQSVILTANAEAQPEKLHS